nr:RodZ domain-containing protein [Syntrophomonas palmitatica]
MEFGDKLKTAREILGYSLDYVEEETKIRRYYLEALEMENFSVLPPRVYASGFVKKYARFLHLDERALTEEFQILAYGNESPREETEHFRTTNYDETKRIRPISILTGLLFLGVVIWLGSMLVPIIGGYATRENEVERTPTNQQPAAPKKNEVHVPPQPVKPVKKQDVQLVIASRQACWMEVKVDGETTYSAIMPPGQKLSFTGKILYILELEMPEESILKSMAKIFRPSVKTEK